MEAVPFPISEEVLPLIDPWTLSEWMQENPVFKKLMEGTYKNILEQKKREENELIEFVKYITRQPSKLLIDGSYIPEELDKTKIYVLEWTGNHYLFDGKLVTNPLFVKKLIFILAENEAIMELTIGNRSRQVMINLFNDIMLTLTNEPVEVNGGVYSVDPNIFNWWPELKEGIEADGYEKDPFMQIGKHGNLFRIELGNIGEEDDEILFSYNLDEPEVRKVIQTLINAKVIFTHRNKFFR